MEVDMVVMEAIMSNILHLPLQVDMLDKAIPTAAGEMLPKLLCHTLAMGLMLVNSRKALWATATNLHLPLLIPQVGNKVIFIHFASLNKFWH